MTERGIRALEDHELESYVAAVTARLGAIPDRDEVLEELRGHLEEVRAEHTGVALRDVLGEPASYADELRAAAGLPPYAPQRAGVGGWLSTRAVTARAHVPRFVHDLRAFWWGVRGLALGLVVFVLRFQISDAIAQNDYVGNWGYRLSGTTTLDTVVSVWGWAPLMTLLVVLLVAGVVVSVWVGGRQARGSGSRWVATLTGILGVLLGLWFAQVLWALLTAAISTVLQAHVGITA